MNPPTATHHLAVILCIVSLLLLTPTLGAKILMLVGNVNSHVLLFSRIGLDLAALGHEIVLVVPSNARRPDFVPSDAAAAANFTYRTYAVDGAMPYASTREASEMLIRVAMTDSELQKFWTMYWFAQTIFRHWDADCSRLVDDAATMREIRDGGFQFAIVDVNVISCHFAIPYSLGIPFASVSISAFVWSYRVPHRPSYWSGLAYERRPTFAERLVAFGVEMTELATLNRTTHYVRKLAPRRPPLDAIGLLQQASLWFFVEDVSVGFPYPYAPNTVAVGDIMAGRPGRPLPADLERFVAGSGTAGVVVVSFGSYFDFVPEDVATKFCDAFRALHPRGIRVVWKLGNPEFCPGLDHVLILPWLPQNDLLADSRVRVLVTHSGLNSLVEAVYHAKPVVVFPIALDQPTNAAAVEYKRFGVRMLIGRFAADELVANIDALLTKPEYQLNAELASGILRDRRDTAAQRMSNMIRHVVDYGDSHLRSGAFELNLFQYIMFDVFLAVLVAFGAVLGLLVLIGCCVYRKCVGRCCSVRKRVGRKRRKAE